ncbi:hypothetical protein QNK09_26985 [Brevibacillus agri]|uniref:hypothetical protein n=1 Tax=Brevibacillus agri TaxID=51101 RepID=UPI0024BFD0D9|nr:hypothetical protein [Brevibacillus agri]WHX30644.1 hypothetical protein QNK09_26985 [Brevibacillus agri]
MEILDKIKTAGRYFVDNLRQLEKLSFFAEQLRCCMNTCVVDKISAFWAFVVLASFIFYNESKKQDSETTVKADTAFGTRQILRAGKQAGAATAA